MKKIAEFYGYENQSLLLIEELSELTKALTKLTRINSGQTSSKQITVEQAIDNIKEEMADVIIMIEQVKDILNISDEDIEEIIKLKIERTNKVMKEDQNKISQF